MDFNGKVALVTGSGRGIGKAIALKLAEAGATLVINDAGDSAPAEQTVAEIKNLNLQAIVGMADVSSSADVNRMMETAIAAFGKVDILVNNAGIIKRIPILDMPISDFKQVIDVDLVAPLIVSKRVVPNMIKKRSGKIINMCSMMSVYGRNTVSAYASAKGGLKLLTQNMTCEWAKYNIQINGIGPGYIVTSQTGPIRENGHPFNDLVMTRTPAGRWGQPEDVANAALFLASKASDFVNGHILYVDGGILANFGYVKGENDL